MSKTKLTYITPVLDFVQAESEGVLNDTLSGATTNPEQGEGEWNPKAKDFYFQFDDSDADFFTWTDSRQRDHTNSSSERARDNKNGGKRRNYNSLQLLNINRKQWNKHYWITLTGLKKKHAKRS